METLEHKKPDMQKEQHDTWPACGAHQTGHCTDHHDRDASAIPSQHMLRLGDAAQCCQLSTLLHLSFTRATGMSNVQLGGECESASSLSMKLNVMIVVNPIYGRVHYHDIELDVADKKEADAPSPPIYWQITSNLPASSLDRGAQAQAACRMQCNIIMLVTQVPQRFRKPFTRATKQINLPDSSVERISLPGAAISVDAGPKLL